MNIKETMEFINSFSKSGKPVNDLSRAENLMRLVGNPEKPLKFVHVAGTNGKGSTVEYISNALIYSGYKTGQFTSPFVLHYADRIRINGEEIDESSLCRLAEFVRDRIDGNDYSQFEITMAIAMLWYEAERCDIVVLEAGIGGLLDCTNVIEPPLLAVITSISHDHTAILGETLEEITAQKSGIIKSGSAVVLSGDQISDEIEDIVYRNAKLAGAEIVQLERCIPVCGSELRFSFIYNGEKYTPAMFGVHQYTNAVTALTACVYLRGKGFELPDIFIKKAIETTQVKARIQYIEGKPPVIVDGAHNPDGVSALADDVLRKTAENKKIFMIIGMVDSKDYIECVDIVSQYAEKMWTVDGFALNSVSAQQLADVVEQSGYADVQACGSLIDAVEQAKKLAIENDGIIVICGSLYLASEYLNTFESAENNSKTTQN